ncbi:MFS transporter [Ammoniphilus sp. 3BR4]|uniref:MFS transporter n=1 Tax=Ammoniphilus sp. 3BR4 TaxID=3158265 RepID=UPI003465CE2F
MGAFARDRSIFLIVSFVLWFSHFLYVPILSPYIESMGGSYTFIGLVLSSYGLMQFLFRLPLGIFSDLVKLRRPFIIFGMVTSVSSCLTFALTDSLGWVLISRALAGIAAATWVAFTVLYASYFADREVHHAMGNISFVVVLAQLLGMSLSGYIVDEWGWKAPFWMGGMVAIMGTVLSFFIFEPKEGIMRTPIQWKDLASVMREPVILKVSLLSILAHSIIFTTMFGFIPTYALNIGLQASDLSLIVFSFMIPHAVATLFMGKVLVPILGQWNSLKFAFLFTACFTLGTPFIETKELLCIIQGLNGFSLGLLFPLLLGMAIETIPQEKRATAMGVYQALYAIGMFVGPFLAGLLNSILGIEAGFYFTGALGLIATAFIVFWSRKQYDNGTLIRKASINIAASRRQS